MNPEPRNPDSEAYQLYQARMIVCARCGQNTGNTSQGHYWRWCKVTRTFRDFHFCCPEDCELTAGNPDP